MRRTLPYSIILLTLIPILFASDLLFGGAIIPFPEIQKCFNTTELSIWQEIIYHIRLPRAIAATLIGVALPISGLLMQTLFRNPLADPFILGTSTGASLGVALCSLAGGIIFSSSAILNSLSTAFAALCGAIIITILILLIAKKIQEITTLLIIGIMIGTVTSAIVSVLQYFSNPTETHSFILWTMGSLANINTNELLIIGIGTILATTYAFILHKKLDTILLGENYARSLGVETKHLQIIIIIISSLLAAVTTAFAGPIGFIGLTVPHIARFLFHTNSHKILIQYSILIGINLMLLCDILSQLPGLQISLPINTVTALLGAPIVIAVIFKNARR